MKTACPCLAGAAALALALVVVATPVPVRAGPNPLNELERDRTSPHAHSAVGAIIDANGGNIPATGEQLVRTLAKLGDFVQLPVTFSAVALDSGFVNPRVVITMRPSSHALRVHGSGWGGGTFERPALNDTKTNHTQLEGRLFLAANMAPGLGGGSRVQTVEFISWNSRTLRFDFGVIELSGSRPELHVLDGRRCFSCHKNRGPILGVAPWSNTTHNQLIREALPRVQADSFARLPQSTAGISLFDAHASEVDGAVRQGAELLRDRAVFKQLVATVEGRKALVLLFDAVLAPGSIREQDELIKKELDTLALGPFLGDARRARRAMFPGELLDFNPAGRLRKENLEWTFGKLARYAEARAEGRPDLPAAHVPSNPKAFVHPPTKAFRRPSEVLSAELLARTIGLTEPDRVFLTGLFDVPWGVAARPDPTRFAMVKQILTGPSFADLMAHGTLPDRDDFKDRFVAEAIAVRQDLLGHSFSRVERNAYTSAPKIDSRAEPGAEAPVRPSHACRGCHDVRPAGKPGLAPIPVLAFDPLDATARDAWLKTADRKRKAEVLSRMLKRIGTDKDMPPEDSTEYELYRQNNPTGLVALKNWLDVELKKVK